jgi:hypothetical protein
MAVDRDRNDDGEDDFLPPFVVLVDSAVAFDAAVDDEDDDWQ